MMLPSRRLHRRPSASCPHIRIVACLYLQTQESKIADAAAGRKINRSRHDRCPLLVSLTVYRAIQPPFCRIQGYGPRVPMALGRSLLVFILALWEGFSHPGLRMRSSVALPLGAFYGWANGRAGGGRRIGGRAEADQAPGWTSGDRDAMPGTIDWLGEIGDVRRQAKREVRDNRRICTVEVPRRGAANSISLCENAVALI
ncbi:hypothetical protein F5884DRAFT_179839 [Xylogone sp. PMI_703]|nr:hypothetical protein F5884DRAFT_179839 [Xylogone sp. PMI_703]